MAKIDQIKTQLQTLIDAANATTGKNDTTVTDAGLSLIEGYGGEDPILQDKTITENGSYTADVGYDGLGTVTVNVAGGGSLEGLENGYDVMFYDEHNDGLAFFSIKKGHAINPPVYECKAWQTADGENIEFPLTPTEDIILYANNSTYASMLYAYYGIDSAVYPYLTITLISAGGITMYASKQMTVNVNYNNVSVTDYYRAFADCGSSIVDSHSDIGLIVSTLMSKCPPDSSNFITSTSKNNLGANSYFYTNYSGVESLSGVLGIYRLDG